MCRVQASLTTGVKILHNTGDGRLYYSVVNGLIRHPTYTTYFLLPEAVHRQKQKSRTNSHIIGITLEQTTSFVRDVQLNSVSPVCIWTGIVSGIRVMCFLKHLLFTAPIKKNDRRLFKNMSRPTGSLGAQKKVTGVLYIWEFLQRQTALKPRSVWRQMQS